MKLTEGWGEAKDYSKGQDDGFKMEEGEGEGKNTFYFVFPFLFPSPPPPSPPLLP